MNLRTTRVHQNPSASYKRTVSNKPLPQKMRVKALHVSGVSARKIAKIEHIDPATVLNIVKEEDVAQHVARLREKWYALGELALAAEQHQLAVKKDGHLGHKVLEGMGVVPRKDQNPGNPDVPTARTPEQGYHRQAIMVANVMLEAHEQMGVSLPEGALERMAEGEVLEVESKKVKNDS